MNLVSIGTPALWIGFILFVLAILVLDLGVFHRKAHAISVREASVWSVIWIGLALVFNAGVYFWFGPERGLEFLTGGRGYSCQETQFGDAKTLLFTNY